MNPGSAPDAVVVGAGIVGSAVARELALGGLSVCVVESGEIGGGATAEGMGHIVVMDASVPEMELTRLSMNIWDEWAPELPPECEYDCPGTLWIATDDEEMAVARSKHANFIAHGVAAEVLDAKAVAEAEPKLLPVRGALRVPGDGILYATAVARWLLSAPPASSRISIRFGKVARLETGRVVFEGGERLDTGFIVNATAIGAPALSPSLPIQPRKGHLIITDRYPGFVRHHLVELGYIKKAHTAETESIAFNIQSRRTGQVLIGSSRQFGVTDRAVDPVLLQKMLARVAQFVPEALELTALRVWTGFRAATPDNLPYIGPVPDQPGVYAATGHEGLGITMAPGTARLIGDLVLARRPAIPVQPFLPGRVSQAMGA